LRTRPIVIEAEPDDDMAYAPDDLVATDAANDPVTAPVPAVDILDLDSADDLDGAYPGDGVRPQDQVLIRAGQAGAAADPGARRPRPTQRPSAEERQNRVGRRKLRRRAEDTP